MQFGKAMARTFNIYRESLQKEFRKVYFLTFQNLKILFTQKIFLQEMYQATILM